MTIVTASIAKAIFVDRLPARGADSVALLSRWAGTEAMSLKLATAETLGDSLDAGVRIVLLSANRSFTKDDALHRALSLVRERSPEIPVVVLSDLDDPHHVRGVSAAGFDGYIPTGLDQPLAFKALSFVLAGGSWFPPEPFLAPDSASVAQIRDDNCSAQGGTLTSRQQEIVQGLKQGDPNKVIARKLNISEATVKIHVRQIMRKLGVSNRTQVALTATASRDGPKPDS